MSQGHRGVLRWLLRLLGAPLVVEALFTGEPWPITLPGALRTLPATGECTELERPAAMAHLESWLEPTPPLPEAYLQLIQRLQESNDDDEDILDLSRYEALPELFIDPLEGSPLAVGYHEIHCHFRGGVPYHSLWSAWREDRRMRGELKRPEHRVLKGRVNGCTWGELVDEALFLRAPAVFSVGSQSVMMEEIELEAVIDALGPLNPGDHLPIARYLAVCIGLRQRLIHQRDTAGLDNFVRSYRRYSKVQKGRPGSSEALLHALLNRMAQDQIASVEIRPTLDIKRADTARKLRRLARAHKSWLRLDDQHPMAMGLVPSLLKTEALPQATAADQQQIWMRQTEGLLRLLEIDPLLRHYVVGLDAAGSEQGIPPRLFAPAFAQVRQYNQRHGVLNQRPGRDVHKESLTPDSSVPFVRLGLTMHAGEDFADPITGLRHIWEALKFLRLGPGDRLGHALAAGLDGDLNKGALQQMLHRRAMDPNFGATRWSRQRFRVAKPIGAHILDLAWQIQCLGLQPALQTALANALARAYAEPTRARSLQVAALSSDLHLPIPAVHFDSLNTLEPEDHIWIELDESWMLRFDLLRSQVRAAMRRGQIVVESCPTSNIAVANLHTHLVDAFHRANIRVAIATDDPGVFGAYPLSELSRFQNAPERFLEKVIAQSQHASFMRHLESP